MRATEFLTEIERLSRDDYTGGKDELEIYQTPGEKKLVPLPGGSGLFYNIRADRDGTRQFIFIVDPKAIESEPVMNRYEFRDNFQKRLAKWRKNPNQAKPRIVAKLSVEAFNSPIPNAVQVGSITVDEDYRGKGLAKALYGIVLSIMKKTLVAGNEQTPGGRRNWVSLTNIPGVEVKGFVQIDTDDVEFNNNDWPDMPVYQHAKKTKEKQVDSIHNNIMKLGGQFIGKNKYAEYWAFDVLPGKGELAPAVKNSLSKLYSDRGEEPTGLYARWVGQ
jgi:ribosomal protein S18 acetylase RimI-like enzyme